MVLMKVMMFDAEPYETAFMMNPDSIPRLNRKLVTKITSSNEAVELKELKLN